jgi:hypothetical protein
VCVAIQVDGLVARGQCQPVVWPASVRPGSGFRCAGRCQKLQWKAVFGHEYPPWVSGVVVHQS